MAAADGAVPTSEATPFEPLAAPGVCDRTVFGAPRSWAPAEAASARAWFLRHARVYVLNLPADPERWDQMLVRLDQLAIPAQRVLGVDLRAPDQLQEAKTQGWIPAAYDLGRAQEIAYRPESDWKGGSIEGTLGCASAHFKLQAQAMQDAYPVAVALEDDSFVSDDFLERVWHLVTAELPTDWQVVALMSRCPYGRCVSRHLLRVQPDWNEPVQRCRSGVNWGMHGMLYRTDALPDLQAKWRPVVFDIDRPHCLDVDVALASISDQVGFYAVPASQNPGFLQELNDGSSRSAINAATFARPTTTATTTTTTPATTATST